MHCELGAPYRGRSMPDSPSWMLRFDSLSPPTNTYSCNPRSTRFAKKMVVEKPADSVVDAKAALLFLARQVLETDPSDRVPTRNTPFTILYRQCPECRSTQVDTRAGPAEINPAAIEPIRSRANTVIINPEDEEPDSADTHRKPTSPAVRRRVALRDGWRCQNPACRSTFQLQVHHIKARSEGGKTNLWNLVTLCAHCHSLVHAGFITLRRKRNGELEWQRKPDTIDGQDCSGSQTEGPDQRESEESPD